MKVHTNDHDAHIYLSLRLPCTTNPCLFHNSPFSSLCFLLCLASPRSPVHGHQSQNFDQISLACFIGVYGTLPNCRDERGSRISLNLTVTQVGLMSGEQRNSQHGNRISHQTQRRVVESAPRACKCPWRVIMSVLITVCTFMLRISGIYIIICL